MDGDALARLDIFGVIAFDGTTLNALKCHPDGVHVLYPMGNKICIQNRRTKSMSFLTGHTNLISTVNVSNSGRFVGSGQITQMGFKAMVVLWDFEKRVKISQHELHKVRVESLVFSCNDSLMISIGGRDCGQILVFCTDRSTIECTTTATKVTTGDAVTLASFNERYNSFISAGDGNVRVWNVDPVKKIPTVADVPLGKLKRYVLCIAISDDDSYGFCGTTSGDVIKFSLNYPLDPNELPTIPPKMIGCYAKCGPWKKNSPRPETIFYNSGVRCIIILDCKSIVIGTGDGTIDLVEEINWKTPLPKPKLYTPASPQFKSIKLKKLNSAITSMQLMTNSNGKHKDKILIVGTKMSEIYTVNLKTFQIMLVVTCHTSSVNDVTFPSGISEVFATAGKGDIRIWSLKTCQELLRIQVSDFTCSKVLFAADGKSIISAWSDGCIRAFKPLSGKLIYNILNTHSGGASAIAITSNGKTLISGGKEGQVRIWDIKQEKQSLKAILKEHKYAVNALQINNTNTEVVSAGADGSCIIWDIINLCRRQVIFAQTMFTSVCYEPTGCEFLTVGTDRRVAYWQAGSGILVREIDASRNAEVNTIHINATGKLFVTGGSDQVLKLWLFNEGVYTHIGSGHSGRILSASFSPDSRYIVSTSSSGSIFIWKCPKEYILQNEQNSNFVPPLKNKRNLELTNKMKTKDENISTMNTARSSIIASCPCVCNKNEDKKAIGACVQCNNSKGNLISQNMCTPPVELNDTSL